MIIGEHVGGSLTPEVVELILETKIRVEIDRRLDPYKGWLPIGTRYEGSIYQEYDNYALEAYEYEDIDIYQIADTLDNNPTNEDFWLNSDVPIEYMYGKGLVKRAPGAIFILGYFNLDTTNFSNYESNYLQALLMMNQETLQDMREQYYQRLLDMYGNRQNAWEFLQSSLRLTGTQ